MLEALYAVVWGVLGLIVISGTRDILNSSSG